MSLPPGTKLDMCPNCLMGAATPDEPGPGEKRESGTTERLDRIGDYELLEVIGQGGMGIVYRARQTSISRLVALKMVLPILPSPTFLRRFQTEIQAAARLMHPNIVPVFEVGESEGNAFFTMPLLAGQTLRQQLRKKEIRPGGADQESSKSATQTRQKSAAALLAKVARAVHYAHENRIFHRDLKPGNILVDESGEPHLLDFGLAKITHLEGEGDDASLTLPEAVLGTPAYMSPEQANGFRKVRLVDEHALAWSDIYSLGAILYELLTGQAPFTGISPQEILHKAQTESPKRPRTLDRRIDKDLEIICLKCLEKNPRNRYNSAADLALDLERWLDSKPILARPIGPLRRAGRWIKRNRLATALIVNLFIGLIVTLAYLDQITHQKEKQELIKNVLFNSITGDISEMTDYPDLEFVTIPRLHLSLLVGQDPDFDDTDADAQLTFGIARNRDATGLAQNWAHVLLDLERIMGERGPNNYIFNFRLFRIGKPGDKILTRQPHPHADIALISPVDYLLAQESAPGLRLLASLSEDEPHVLFVARDSPVDNVAGLKGRIVALPSANSAAATYAKACLADAALASDSVQLLELREDESTDRAVINLVRDGRYHAGLCTLIQFERARRKEPGLRLLERIPSLPDLLVARAGLPTNALSQLQTALCELPEYPAMARFKPVTDDDLADLRQALEKSRAAFPDAGTAKAASDLGSLPPPSPAPQ